MNNTADDQSYFGKESQVTFMIVLSLGVIMNVLYTINLKTAVDSLRKEIAGIIEPPPKYTIRDTP
jgi:hypothetical protein